MLTPQLALFNHKSSDLFRTLFKITSVAFKWDKHVYYCPCKIKKCCPRWCSLWVMTYKTIPINTIKVVTHRFKVTGIPIISTSTLCRICDDFSESAVIGRIIHVHANTLASCNSWRADERWAERRVTSCSAVHEWAWVWRLTSELSVVSCDSRSSRCCHHIETISSTDSS